MVETRNNTILTRPKIKTIPPNTAEIFRITQLTYDIYETKSKHQTDTK